MIDVVREHLRTDVYCTILRWIEIKTDVDNP